MSDWRTKKLRTKPKPESEKRHSVLMPRDEWAYLEKVQLLYQAYEGAPMPRYQVIVTGLRLLEQTLERKMRLRRQA